MQLLLGFHHALPGTAPWARSPAELTEAVLDHTMAAEELGFDVVWSVDADHQPCAPLAAALGARTRRLRVGALWRVSTDLHPLRLAEDSATLDGASEGRLLVGLRTADPGSWSTDGEPRLAETLAVLAQAWREGPVRPPGPGLTSPGVEVFPKPCQQPGPPVWLASEAKELAVRHGCGLWTASLEAAHRFLEAWSASGKDPGDARLALALDWTPGLEGPGGTEGAASLERLRRSLEPLTPAGEIQLLFPSPLAEHGPDTALRSLRSLADRRRGLDLGDARRTDDPPLPVRDAVPYCHTQLRRDSP